MVTTFERLAKVIKGYIKPANWIERAFASIGEAVSNIPAVTNSDRGKFLGVNVSNNNLGWKGIRQVPAVGTEDKGKYLKANDSTGELEWDDAGGTLNVHISGNPNDGFTVDKTYTEIATAITNGIPCFGIFDGMLLNATYIGEEEPIEFNGYTFNVGEPSELFFISIKLSDDESVAGYQASVNANA